MSSGLSIPSFQQGFARNASESEYPELWRGLVGAWCPFLGPTGWTLRDLSGWRNHGTLTSMDPATDWLATAKGWALDFSPVACPNEEHVRLPTGCFAGVNDDIWTLDWVCDYDGGNGRVFFGEGVYANRNSIRFYDATIRIYSNSLTYVSISTSTAGRHAWRIVCSGAAYTLYRDGILQGTDTDANSMDISDWECIGGLGQSGSAAVANQFDGRCTYLAVYGRSLRVPPADPFALLRVRRRRVFAVAAPAGGLFINPGRMDGLGTGGPFHTDPLGV